LLCLFLIPLTAATPIPYHQTLEQLGHRKPIRLSGFSFERSFYFTLPVRGLDASASRLRIDFTASPNITADSYIEVLVGDQSRGQKKVLPNQAASFEIPGIQSKESDFLKVTIKGTLKHATIHDRCVALSLDELWVDLLPTTVFQTRFDSQNPDWLSVSRLPLTLRARPYLFNDETWTPSQEDLALKLASWVAFHNPEDVYGMGSVGPILSMLGLEDLFQFQPKPGKVGIELKSMGMVRFITISASTAEECAKVWETLKSLQTVRAPGSSWSMLRVQVGEQENPSKVLVNTLSSDFCETTRGMGIMSKSFGFDSVMFSRNDIAIHFRAKIKHQAIVRLGSVVASVYANGNLVYSTSPEVGTSETEVSVLLTPQVLREDNLINLEIAYYPTMEECKNPLFNFSFQVDPTASLEVSDIPYFVLQRDDLVSVARRYFGRNSYYVLLPENRKQDWFDTTLSAVSWMQRINQRALLDPTLADMGEITSRFPVLAVGDEKQRLVGMLHENIFPVTSTPRSLVVKASDDTLLCSFDPGTSVGFWQLIYQKPSIKDVTLKSQPVIMASGWGPEGDKALLSMTRQVNETLWVNDGNIVVGDGKTPLYSFSSRKVQFFVDQEELRFGKINWDYWRWWAVALVWIVMTVVIGGILRKAYKQVKN
jgi:hypothetical protein